MDCCDYHTSEGEARFKQPSPAIIVVDCFGDCPTKPRTLTLTHRNALADIEVKGAPTRDSMRRKSCGDRRQHVESVDREKT